ncbi:MAG: glycoside hydrolase family 18 protein [Candidatus Pacebacteria bacterium]|nr:glycoside hydrolase family 18 protein [Candidatus Paceibacterota bacterium]
MHIIHPNLPRSVLLALILSVSVAPFATAQAGLLLGGKEQAKVATRTNGLKADADAPWLMAYYVGYQNSYLKPNDVDYSLMTHIVVGGVGVNADGTLDEHWHMKNGDGHAMALDVGERADRAGVKQLIWLGGPNEESDFFSATTDARRATFVKNILALIDNIGYDGVDIDWEPIRKGDEAQILALVRDLREARPNLLIAVPVNWVQTTLVGKKDLSLYKDLSAYVDRLFIMSYSMAGAWPGWKSWHAGALTGDTSTTPGSVQTSAKAYLEAGVPNNILGIGIGTYATCWEYPIKTPSQTMPSKYAPGDIGVMSMRTLMGDYYSKKYEKWDSRAKVPYLSFKKARGDFKCGFISYENERSIREKMAYVKKEQLGGAIVWNIGTGYFPDASRSKRHPLLKTAWEELVR